LGNLFHYGYIDVDDGVLFEGSVEAERALLIKIIYQNRTGRDIRMTLPDRTHVHFPQGDTIRLVVIRKYIQDNLESLLKESGVHVLGSSHFDFGGRAHNGLGFGMDLLVLAADAETSSTEPNKAVDLWRRAPGR
jgi:L-histidine Nalpha-methyltransferase